ncbi:HAMP domain-containing sensor histidine kinase [Paenibacillus sp. 481]|uniref:HAMP domain-containing sensor histidine kinase n=1 Tax=Paenibacillus sp. 481 TaxID=2835869 RepID=UPI001E4F7B20|nr:HAMP domain-containing sensor histidine kinase [Paenibacillus sp. 481]
MKLEQMKVPFFRSMLAKYMLIVLGALLVWPLVFPITALITNLPLLLSDQNDHEAKNIYANGERIEQEWHQTAGKLKAIAPEEIKLALHEMKRQYPKAQFFWVDSTGHTQLALPERGDLPQQWSAADSIHFVKQTYDGNPFTSIAFIGKDPKQGFIAIQIERSLMVKEDSLYGTTEIVIVIAVIFIAFVTASWLFFYHMRKRLVHLEEAMTTTDDSGFPHPVEVKKWDEIGRLEQAFNQMIGELHTSREREREEEELRKKLIANLSHDLRTPLTTIRGHAHSLGDEVLSAKGKQSLALIDAKVDDVGQLVDNLFSYTLLSAKKYPFHPERLDILRLVRTSAASWYPIWEKEGLEVHVDLPDEPLMWNVDPLWMKRILDNLFQNIMRHAVSGRYIGIRVEAAGRDAQATHSPVEAAGRDAQATHRPKKLTGDGTPSAHLPVRHTLALIIEDRGPGIQAASEDKGAGIGLTIVSMMMREMDLQWELRSSVDGTQVVFFQQTDLKLNET